jgi:hypothetical protein
MSFLFGHLYETPCKFTHDQAMFRKMGGDVRVVPESRPDTQDNRTEPSVGKNGRHEREACPSSSNLSLQHRSNATISHTRSRDQTGPVYDRETAPIVSNPYHATKKQRRSDDGSKSDHETLSLRAERNAVNISNRPSAGLQVSSAAPLSSHEYSEAWKQQAFEAATGTGSSNWNDITLVSVSGHQEREEEL